MRPQTFREFAELRSKEWNCVQVRDQIEKENVSGQPKGNLPPLPSPGSKVDIKASAGYANVPVLLS